MSEFQTLWDSPLGQILVTPLTGRLLLIAAFFICILLGRDLIREWLRSLARVLLGLPDDDPLVFLELTFPADNLKAPFATSQLYSLLKSGTQNLNWLERLAVRPRRYSLELVATKSGGIRYLIAVPASQADSIHESLLSYLSGLKVRRVADYLPTKSKARVRDLRLSSDCLLPLKGQGEQRFHDPIAYIAGHMRDLDPEDLVAYQIILCPVSNLTHPKLTARLDGARDTIMAGLPASPLLKNGVKLPGLLLATLWVLEHTFGLIVSILTLMLLGPQKPKAPLDPDEPPPPLPKHEQALTDTMLLKINDHLFETAIRVLVASPDRTTRRTKSDAVLSAFRLFTSHYQSLIPTKRKKGSGNINITQTAFGRRVLPVRPDRTGTILGTTELTDLYHFPDTDRDTAPFLKTRTPELPLPYELGAVMDQDSAQYGQNHHAGITTPIRIPHAQRARHTYVFGRTGTGKTTLLTRAIYDDLALTTNGLAVLDPHGDMFNQLLGIVPEHRRKDIIIFDPSDRDWPIGLNLLNPGIDFIDSIEAGDRITSAVIAVFQKLSGDFWGPRMEHILRNVTLTALSTKDPNLFTLQRLLTDRDYMKEVAKDLGDPVLQQFWDYQLGLAKDLDLSSITLPLTSRLGHFLTTGMSRHILLQRHTAVSMSEVMDQGKVLLVNLSKGQMGEDESSFFGTIMTSLLWMAALARSGKPESQRPDFYVYVDEFQNFATKNFAEIISEGRKYHIGLTLAHQSVSQITDRRILDTIASNAGTILSFAGGPSDEAFLKPFFSPHVQDGQIMNLPPKHFYIKTKDIPGADTFTGRTSNPTELPPYSHVLSKSLKTQSQTRYGIHRDTLDAYFATLFIREEPKPPEVPPESPPPRKKRRRFRGKQKPKQGPQPQQIPTPALTTKAQIASPPGTQTTFELTQKPVSPVTPKKKPV